MCRGLCLCHPCQAETLVCTRVTAKYQDVGMGLLLSDAFHMAAPVRKGERGKKKGSARERERGNGREGEKERERD